MTHTYHITGLTCSGCVAKAKSVLLKLGDITAADVQLAPPQATLTMQHHIATTTLQEALTKAGDYTITEANGGMHQVITEENTSWLATYKPLLLLGAYLIGITAFIEVAQDEFNWMRCMQHFMAGFFLAFSFFKLLDVKGFAESYATYDVVEKRWYGWGFVYPFIELALGIAFLVGWNLRLTNIIAFAVMGIGLVGVLQSVLNKRRIQCACLGAVFNLPMSTVTVIENTLMMLMSAAMVLPIL